MKVRERVSEEEAFAAGVVVVLMGFSRALAA